ncbi:hypothetical protein ACFIOY_02490 [Bradyrhizobium sp. TZ2]
MLRRDKSLKKLRYAIPWLERRLVAMVHTSSLDKAQQITASHATPDEIVSGAGTSILQTDGRRCLTHRPETDGAASCFRFRSSRP